MMKCDIPGQNSRPLVDFQSVFSIREPLFDYVYMNPLLQINPITGDPVQYDFNVILAAGIPCCHRDGRTPEGKMNSTINPSAFRIPLSVRSNLPISLVYLVKSKSKVTPPVNYRIDYPFPIGTGCYHPLHKGPFRNAYRASGRGSFS